MARKRIRPEPIKAIEAELLALSDSESGQEVLKRIGLQQFDTGSAARMRELLKRINI